MSRPEEFPPGVADLLRGLPAYDPFRGAAGCWYEPGAAKKALDFFPAVLRHIEGDAAGTPFVLSPWQQSFVANLIGWKRTDARGRTVRRYRESLLYVCRKNGKTPLTAGLGLYLFFCDREPGQQGYIAAKDKDQAGLLFRQMQGMVGSAPGLAELCQAYGGNAPAGASKSFVKPDNSFLKVISADASGKHGGLPHLVIVDELHEQTDRRLVDTLRTSLSSENRKQPLMIYLTTADYDRPSICNEIYGRAKRVQADPGYDPSFLPAVWEADPGDPFDDPGTWRKSNPNLGVSVSEEYLRRESKLAADNPALLVEFRRLHTNVRVQSKIGSAIDLALWDGCRADPPDPGELAGRPCWAGLDLGWRDDFAALVRLWPLPDGGPVYADFHFWLPRGGKRELRASPFAEFVAGDWLELTEGNTTDFAAIREVLEDTRGRFELRELMMDPSYARSEATELANAGFPLKEFRQNMANYSIPWKWLVADGLKGRKLAHGGNPVARWMAGHVAVEVNGTEGVMPRKRKSAEKIDGITALCMGLASWLGDPQADATNVYETRGPLIL